VDANDWKQADHASRRGPFFTGALGRRDGGLLGTAFAIAQIWVKAFRSKTLARRQLEDSRLTCPDGCE
jgi:hypothetical protein